MFTGVVVSLPFVFVLGSDFIGRVLASGALSGVLVGAGLSVVDRGRAVASSAVVAPAAAVLAARGPLVG